MVTKAQAEYVFAPGCDVVCGECQFRAYVGLDLPRCLFMGPKAAVDFQGGSCNRYKSGDRVTAEWFAPFLTPEEIGYTFNKVGFGCRRCEYFRAGKDDCETVIRKSPGATPGIIDPFGCCDFWDKDKVRGRMTNEQLVQILTAKPMSHSAEGIRA